MRFLLDACISRSTAQQLVQAGHDVVRVVEIQHDMPDAEILSLANSEQRILITEDDDFGQLVVLHGQPNSGVIRLVNIIARDQAKLVLQAIGEYTDDLLAGAIVNVTYHRTRSRRPAGGSPESP